MVLRNLTPCFFYFYFFLFNEEKHECQVSLRVKSRGGFLLYFSLPGAGSCRFLASSSFPLATPNHARLEKQH